MASRLHKRKTLQQRSLSPIRRREYGAVFLGRITCTSGSILDVHGCADFLRRKTAADEQISVPSAAPPGQEFDVGLRYRRDLAQIFSAWLSAQLGEGIIAYLETALRDNARFLDIELMPERNIGWNADFLVGFGFTPREIGASVYIEYRARSAGYSTEEYRAILSSPYWRQGALLASFPYMQSARHVIGIHLMRTGDDGPLDWSMTCMYFPPDGLDLSARAELKLFDQCSLDAELGLAAPLAGVSIGTSETALRIDVLRCSVGLQWKFSAEETR